MTVAEEGLPAEGTVAEGAAAGVAVAPQRRATSFAGDVLKLVSGTTLAQAIGVLITPILTRMYAPEAFGTLALFTSITGIISVVACLRYELAIMLPETDEEAANLLAVSLVAVVAITALTVPAVTLGRPLLVRLLKAPDLGPYLWLVPIAVFFGGVFQALNYWNSRTKQFGRLSVARVVNSLATYTTKLGAGLAGHLSAAPLIGATLVGSMLSTGILGAKIWRDDHKLFASAIRVPAMGAGTARHKRFPLIDVWGSLLNTISWQLPALMLSSFFSTSVVGYYSLGLRMLQLPMSLIGGAIGQVFFQRAAEAKSQGVLAATVRSTFQQLVTIGLFPMLVLGISGRENFTVVFGSQWAQAGVYAQILSLWTFWWFISSPLSSICALLDRQDIGLRLSIITVITRLASLYSGGLAENVHIALFLFSASGVLVYALLIVEVFRLCDINLRFLMDSLKRPLLLFLPSSLVILGSSYLTRNPYLVFSTSLICTAFYYCFEWRCHHQRHVR